MDGTEPDLWMSISRLNHTTSNTNRVSLLIILILTNLFTRQTLLYYISDCRLAESIGLLFGGSWNYFVCIHGYNSGGNYFYHYIVKYIKENNVSCKYFNFILALLLKLKVFP